MNIAEIESEALALAVDDRACLAHRLFSSLQEVVVPEFDRLWGEESARRAAEFDSGQLSATSGEQVARKARALIR